MEHTTTQCLPFYLCCIKVETHNIFGIDQRKLHVTHKMCYFDIPTTNTSILQYSVEHMLMKWKQERALYHFLECLSINTTHGAVIRPPQREWAKWCCVCLHLFLHYVHLDVPIATYHLNFSTNFNETFIKLLFCWHLKQFYSGSQFKRVTTAKQYLQKTWNEFNSVILNMYWDKTWSSRSCYWFLTYILSINWLCEII